MSTENKYERRYKSELTALVSMIQKELELIEGDVLFSPSDTLLSALREAREAGIRLGVALEIIDKA